MVASQSPCYLLSQLVNFLWDLRKAGTFGCATCAVQWANRATLTPPMNFPPATPHGPKSPPRVCAPRRSEHHPFPTAVLLAPSYHHAACA